MVYDIFFDKKTREKQKKTKNKSEIDLLKEKLDAEWYRFNNLHADDFKEIENTLNMIKAYEQQFDIKIRRLKNEREDTDIRHRI